MTPAWELKGKDLLHGETDGPSYPNGLNTATGPRPATNWPGRKPRQQAEALGAVASFYRPGP
jgi:hypothetical protein